MLLLLLLLCVLLLGVNRRLHGLLDGALVALLSGQDRADDDLFGHCALLSRGLGDLGLDLDMLDGMGRCLG